MKRKRAPSLGDTVREVRDLRSKYMDGEFSADWLAEEWCQLNPSIHRPRLLVALLGPEVATRLDDPTISSELNPESSRRFP